MIRLNAIIYKTTKWGRKQQINNHEGRWTKDEIIRGDGIRLKMLDEQKTRVDVLPAKCDTHHGCTMHALLGVDDLKRLLVLAVNREGDR